MTKSAPRKGSRITWKFGSGRYGGKVTRVTAKHIYARTENGKIKKIAR